MKRLQYSIAVFALLLLTMTGCKKWLDINTDPDTPQNPNPASVFPTQLAAIPRGIQFDARYLSKYTQMFHVSASSRPASEINWDRHGWVANSDVSGDIWRQLYFGLGKNIDYIINVGSINGQWDLVGAAFALRAYYFQLATDYHGELIYTEAFRENQTAFKYDAQDVVYAGVRNLCDSAIKYLERTDLNPGAVRLAVGDYVYNGDVEKWKKFVYGVLARNYNNLANKNDYDPAKVIEYVDKSLASGADDFLIPFDATKTEDANFFGPFRDNLTFFRQSNWIVKLLDGTTFAGNSDSVNRDPRIRHMLSMSQDTTNGNGGYRGVNPAEGDVGAARTRVATPWGDSVYANPRTVGVFIPNLGKYLFKDKAVSPIMTYAEMQFIKAEAALRMDNRALALEAYTKGINAHFDFINRTSFPRGNNTLFNGSQITTAQRNGYLNNPALVKTDPALLTMTDIMLQKYIALWGWGFVETWTDMRKFHYTDIDQQTSEQVYKGLVLPTFDAGNLSKPAYRVRPRYNSEYVWNRPEIERIGGMNGDYHTYELWYSKPN
jgi:hypothetical protein